MRIITRRRVKVRVTVRRGDGSVTSHGWSFHRKREDDGHDRKHDERDTDEGVTPADSQSASGEPPPACDPLHYDSVCDDKNVDVELEEDADYEHPKGPVYESVDKEWEGIYEEVGRKGLRVRFEGENDIENYEEDDMDGSIYSTGAIPKRGNASASVEEGREDEDMNGNVEEEDDGELYEPIGEVSQASEPRVPSPGPDKEHNAFTRDSKTCVCDYDEPRKIEVTVTSKREGGEYGEREVHCEREKTKLRKRGKVEVKFSPWQTEGCGRRTKATDCKCDNLNGNFKVDQRTELSYSDKSRQKHRTDHSDDVESPYEIHHRSNIEVSAESVTSDKENEYDDVNGQEKKSESSSRGRERRSMDMDKDEEDDFGDDENDTYQRGRPRVKKRTMIRVNGIGVDKDVEVDADGGLIKTVSKTVVTFGRGLSL